MGKPSISVVILLSFSAYIAAQNGSGIAVSPSAIKPLPEGTKAPDAQLSTADGKSITLKSILKGKPTVLIFFRGGWCPFCNRHLADLGTIDSQLTSMGYQLVAISPDQPSKTMETAERTKAKFRLFSDSKTEAIRRFGIGFRVDDSTFATYRDQYKLDLEAWSGKPHHILPVPSVFIIDANGLIRFAHTNPDYKVRMKGTEILAAAKAAMDPRVDLR